jgi:hypothetical protein
LNKSEASSPDEMSYPPCPRCGREYVEGRFGWECEVCDAPAPIAEYVLTLTLDQAKFVHQVGRYLRKQEGWWDDSAWQEIQWAVSEMFEALPYGWPEHTDGDERAVPQCPAT